jgi:ABC-type sugar transport system ATPase subunit
LHLNISMGSGQGEFTAIMGKSGSGKSTLINMITGIDHPTTGKVSIGGTELYRFKEGQMAEWRGKHLGIVFQFFQLLPTLTILEKTLLPMDYCNVYLPAGREINITTIFRRERPADLVQRHAVNKIHDEIIAFDHFMRGIKRPDFRNGDVREVLDQPHNLHFGPHDVLFIAEHTDSGWGSNFQNEPAPTLQFKVISCVIKTFGQLVKIREACSISKEA